MTTAPDGNVTDEAPVDLDNAPLRRLLTLIRPYVWVTGIIPTGVAVYALRHTHPSWLEARGIASDASFGRYGDRDPVRDLGFRTGRPARWRCGRHAL